MPLEIQRRDVQGIAILDLTGRLVFGAEDLELDAFLQSLLAAGQKNVILNLRDVSHIDGAAEGSLLSSAEKLKSAGGRMVLLHVPPTHARVDELLKLDTAFETYQNEPDAVNGFFPDRALPQYDLLEFLDQEAVSKGEESEKKPA
jgi:anti-sigma B factor antagonist